MSESIWNGKRLGCIGGGNMAEALIRGVVASGLLPASSIIVYDIVPERRAVFAGMGCAAAETPAEAMRADVVLFAVKPQNLLDALADQTLGEKQVLISIAAGVTCARIEALLPEGSRVVRVMPNTPLLVGFGMSALAAGSHADAGDMALAMALFAAGGEAVEVAEEMLDAVTALSGSGPAYLFRFAEALTAGAEKLGLDSKLARRLAIGMLRGSAEMLVREPDAALLRQRVTSPGGTTAAALDVFEQRGFMGITAEALKAARDRGAELGREP